MRRPRPRSLAGLAALAALAAVGTASLLASSPGAGARPAPPAPVSVAPSGSTALARSIALLQRKVRDDPRDALSLAGLGLSYVAQAKATVDPSYYPKARAVLARSLALQPGANFTAMAGQAALAAAEHDFTAALGWARKGLAIDPASATLYGALDDAQTQLGHYGAASAAVQKMLDLHPGIPAYTRAEYVFELRGDLPRARESLNRVLTEATEPADIAFAHHYLGELAFGGGDYRSALRENEEGLRVDPSSYVSLDGRARAHAALGETDAAVRDYADLVARVPDPQYVVEYGRLLDSLGRKAEAGQQYRLFEVENALFESNGVALDSDPTLFYAERGDGRKALSYGVKGLRARPFIEMEDAYAWALHAAGRDKEALGYARRAVRLGTRSALFDYHRGMIEKSLGERAAALRSLRHALATSPAFDPLDAPRARAAIATLAAQP